MDKTDQALLQYAARIRALRAEDANQKQVDGVTTDNPNADPHCPDCKGLGFLRDDEPEFDEDEFGKVKPCHCVTKAAAPSPEPESIDANDENGYDPWDDRADLR